MTFWIDHNHNLVYGFRDLVVMEAPDLSAYLKEQDNNVAKLKHFKITTFKWKILQDFSFFGFHPPPPKKKKKE